MRSSQNGSTIIEILAVLVIVSIGAIYAARVAMGIYKDIEFDELRENAQLMLLATNSYYEASCSLGNFQPTVSGLVSRKFLHSAEQAKNPFGAELLPVIIYGDPSKIEVRAVITTASPSASDLLYSVEANRVSGNTLYWTELPRVLTNQESIELMEMKHLYQPTKCL